MAVRVFFETGKRIALVACGPLAGSSEHSAQLGPGLPYPQARIVDQQPTLVEGGPEAKGRVRRHTAQGLEASSRFLGRGEVGLAVASKTSGRSLVACPRR